MKYKKILSLVIASAIFIQTTAFASILGSETITQGEADNSECGVILTVDTSYKAVLSRSNRSVIGRRIILGGK